MGQSKPRLPSDAPRRGARCPICKAPSEAAFRPFCSVRCADADLSRWLRGGYVIPGAGPDSDEDGDDTHAAQRPSQNTHQPIDEDE